MRIRFYIFTLCLVYLAPMTTFAGESSSGAGGITKLQGLATSGMGVVAGKMFQDQCKNSPPACAMSALSYGNAALSLMSAMSGAESEKSYKSKPTGTFDIKDLDSGLQKDLAGLGINTETDLDQYIKKQQENLQDKGYGLNPDGSVKTPKGNFGAGAFASASSMVDAGIIDASQAGDVQKKIDSITNKFKMINVNLPGGSGGGASSATKYSYEDPYKNLYGSVGGEKPDAGKTEGLTRVLSSGEVVGAQTDNIFEMVRRNYREKDAAGQFDLRANAN